MRGSIVHVLGDTPRSLRGISIAAHLRENRTDRLQFDTRIHSLIEKLLNPSDLIFDLRIFRAKRLQWPCSADRAACGREIEPFRLSVVFIFIRTQNVKEVEEFGTRKLLLQRRGGVPYNRGLLCTATDPPQNAIDLPYQLQRYISRL